MPVKHLTNRDIKIIMKLSDAALFDGVILIFNGIILWDINDDKSVYFSFLL